MVLVLGVQRDPKVFQIRSDSTGAEKILIVVDDEGFFRFPQDFFKDFQIDPQVIPQGHCSEYLETSSKSQNILENPLLVIKPAEVSEEVSFKKCSNLELTLEAVSFVKDFPVITKRFLSQPSFQAFNNFSVLIKPSGEGRKLVQCEEGSNGCKTCLNPNFCNETLDGFYLDQVLGIPAGTCERGCKTCLDQNNCTACFDGYFLSSKSCIPCPMGCLSCSSQFNCSRCDYGFYLDMKTCKSCMLGCSLCANSTHCGRSIEGFSISSGLSQECPEGCKSCSGSDCTVCESSFYIQSSQCFPCSEGCSKCANPIFCEVCIASHYLSSSKICLPCPSNCLACSDGFCTSCRPSFYISTSGSCTDCISNCKNCENSISCEICNEGFYYLKNLSVCKPCDSGCLYCTEEKCLQCVALGYWNNTKTAGSKSGICSPCPAGCEVCPLGSCDSCQAGYYLDSGSCLVCSDRCKTCSGLTRCSSCDLGFKLVEGICQKCQYGCLSCEKSVCNACQVGFYLEGNKCIMCALSCFSCSGSQKCNLCKPGYYLTGSTCQRCNEGSRYCNSTSSFACNQGFFLETTECKSCDKNCLICSSVSNCLRCLPGYVLSQGSCVLCSSSCSVCPSKYFLKSGACLNCTENCLNCNSNGTCIDCVSGYWLNQNICSSCGENCKTCLNSTYCLFCLDGFEVDSEGKCQPCTSSQCLCESSYYSNASYSCSSCLNRCETCASNSTCLACIAGYYLGSNLTCLSCPKNCKSCSGTSCLVCEAGFILQGSSCVPCEPYCLSCTSLGTCSVCQTSFYLKASSDCSPCKENCKTCDSSSCKQCFPGFFLDSSGLCSQSVENCLIYDSSSVCSYCSTGFTAKNGKCYICENIEIVKSYFISDFSRIEIEFNININTTFTSSSDCAECKDIARSDANYGGKCKCEAVNNIFRIILGNDFSMTSSSKILVVSEKLFKYICNDEQRILNTSPQYTDLPLDPVVELDYQPILSFNCYSKAVNFDVVSVKNSYGFDVSYTWILTTQPSNLIAEGLAMLANGNSLSLDFTVFQNIETTLNITVFVTSMVSLKGSISAVTNLKIDKYIAGKIDIESPRKLYYNKEYTITGKIIDSCEDVTTKFKWFIEGQDMSKFNSNLPHILYIPAFSLVPKDSNYKAKLLLSNSNNDQGEVNFTLAIEYSPLVIILNTESSYISVNKNYTLSASKSYNPNINNEVTKYQGLSFDWYCCIHKENQTCSLTSCPDDVKSNKITFLSSYLKDKINSYLRVQLILSQSTYPSASKTAELFISNSDVQIDLYSSKEKYEMVNFGELFVSNVIFNSSIMNLTLKWEISGGRFTKTKKIIGETTPNLYVYRRSLEESDKYYKFTLNAYNQGTLVSSSSISITKNIPPICSSGLAVTPENQGKSQIFNHNFLFKIYNCVDIDEDYPLTYRFALRVCESKCEVANILNGTSINSAYYQLSIQKSFNKILAKVFHTSFNASVQVCDSLKTCSTSAIGPINASKADRPSNIIESFIDNTKLYDMIPYYSIMYIKLFRNFLSSDEYNYIYRLYSWYMRKIKIVNFDVAHICLSFINEQFKITNGPELKIRYIRLYLDESYRIMKRNTDILTQQNADVFSEILNNVLLHIKDDKTSINLLDLVLSYITGFVSIFSNDRVVGDLIFSKLLTNAKIFMIKDKADNLILGLPETMKQVLVDVKSLSAKSNDIVTILTISMKFEDKTAYYSTLGSAGSYNNQTLKYVMHYLNYLPIKEDSLIIYINDSQKNDRCFGFEDMDWVKNDFCSMTSDSSTISVSSDKIIRVEDKDYFTFIPETNLSPLGLSVSLLALTFIVCLYLWYKQVKDDGNSGDKRKQLKMKALTFSTKEVILLNTLSLSFFSYNPNITKIHKLLQLAFILNVQLLIDGGFYGWNVLTGKNITVIVGTGFIAPMITLPLNILATFNIPHDMRRLRITFVISWIVMLSLCTVGVAYINAKKALGESSYWILSFAIGLSCEAFVQALVMFIKNMIDRDEFDQEEKEF